MFAVVMLNLFALPGVANLLYSGNFYGSFSPKP